MQVEAALPPTQVRFEKLCKNYALRILQMQDSHPVKMRAPFNSPFSSENSGIDLTKLNCNTTNSQLADWNQSLSYSESESEPEFYSQRRKNRARFKKKRKFSSQIFRLCSYLKETISADSSSKIEQFNSAWKIPWQKSTIETEIDENDKIAAADNHRKLILDLQQNHSANIIIYADGSKLATSQAGAESYISYSMNNQQSYYWHLNSTVESFDIELFAILKSLQQVKAHIQNLNSNSIQHV